jgi:hypothetical protein
MTITKINNIPESSDGLSHLAIIQHPEGLPINHWESSALSAFWAKSPVQVNWTEYASLVTSIDYFRDNFEVMLWFIGSST